jgi:hypothetical protein
MSTIKGLAQMIQTTEVTYWNNKPCNARKVTVIVAKAEKPTLWYAAFEGSERQAVEVSDANQSGGRPFYLDNEDGSGWLKVTKGKGSMMYGHRNLEITAVIE